VDQLFAFRSSSEKFRPPYDHTIVHVDLNNTTIERLKSHYLDRSHFAQVTRNLSSMGVSAQVYDFIFPARLDEAKDESFIEAVRDAGNVYLGLAFELYQEGQILQGKKEEVQLASFVDERQWHLDVRGAVAKLYIGMKPLSSFFELVSVSKGVGSLSIKFDRDGVLRRVPLFVRYKEAFYPTLPFRVICDYLEVPPEKIVVEVGEAVTLKGATLPEPKGAHDIAIPIDERGCMIVNYVGPWGEMDHYNFADIFLASNDRVELEMWKEEMRNKIAVISDVSTGSSDVGPVPTDANFPLSGIHANIMNGILTESFLRELSDREMLIAEVVLLAFVLFLSARFASLYFSLGTLALAGCYAFTVGLGFLYGHVIFHLVRPLLMIAFAMVSIVVYSYVHEEKEKIKSLRQRDFIRATFGRYLSNEVVEELLGAPRGLEMGGEIREVTFMVSDLRGFTALSARLSPQEVIDILNRYLERMVKIVSHYRGTVNEIEGDGILAFFGAPLTGEDDEARAVACAIAMQRAMLEMNSEQRQLSLPELAMGIGINSGEVVVGNIGSKERAKYGAIGTPINTAYRIESYTVGGQILISPSTRENVKNIVKVRGTMEVQFKGIDHPVTLYDVEGIEGSYEVSLPVRPAVSLAEIRPPIPITCFVLEGKTVLKEAVSGFLTHLGEFAAKATLDQTVAARSNLKVLLAVEEGAEPAEAYVKVVSVEPPAESASSAHRVHLEFTWVPDDVRRFFENNTRG
jgi:class 3 adenylate cyclase/CHASE2 domain-containing sensor protein